MELIINIIMTNLIEPQIRKLINPVLNNNLLHLISDVGVQVDYLQDKISNVIDLYVKHGFSNLFLF